MGQGINLARVGAPEHAAILDNFKDQLLLVLIRKLGGNISIPVSEVDDTGGCLLVMSVNDGVFNFEVREKQ
jgi:hypothetical protein